MEEEINGSGFFDILKNPLGYIKEAFASIPTKLNNISTKTLKEYGQQPITMIQIIRTPLSDVWNKALNVLSFGVFDNLKKKHGYDKLFHLSLIITVSSGHRIIVEKNEVINIAPFKNNDVNNMTEIRMVALNGRSLTMNEMIDNTLKYMGNEKFYDYDALRGNNCQNFILSILMSNNLLTEDNKQFIFQDMRGLVNDLSKTSSHLLPHALKKITELGSRASRLMGKGKQEKHDFIRFVNENGFRFL